MVAPSANPVACPKCKTATILHPVVAESTGFVQPYRLRRCPTCDWQQYENISRAEQAEAMRDRAVPPTNKVAVAACPFCGGTDTACGIADEEFGRFWVECICGARGPTVETLKDARPAWNKRLAPEPDGRLAKAAELLREVRAYDSHRDNTLACEFTAEGWIEERDEWLASLSTTKGASDVQD